jgi:hypothetical protein
MACYPDGAPILLCGCVCKWLQSLAGQGRQLRACVCTVQRRERRRRQEANHLTVTVGKVQGLRIFQDLGDTHHRLAPCSDAPLFKKPAEGVFTSRKIDKKLL